MNLHGKIKVVVNNLRSRNKQVRASEIELEKLFENANVKALKRNGESFSNECGFQKSYLKTFGPQPLKGQV